MNKINRDFQSFLHPQAKQTSEQIDQEVLAFVKRDLRPSHQVVYGKILSIQAFIGTLTLLFCPQFNLSLTNRYEVYHFFHRTFGHYGCMAICGFIFVGAGSLFAGKLLRLSEIELIKRSRLLYFTSLSGIFVLGFLLVGADVYLDLSLFWLLGALFGGLSMFEVGRQLKVRFI